MSVPTPDCPLSLMLTVNKIQRVRPKACKIIALVEFTEHSALKHIKYVHNEMFCDERYRDCSANLLVVAVFS